MSLDGLDPRVFSAVHYLFSFFSEYLNEIDMAVAVYVGVPKHNSITAYNKILEVAHHSAMRIGACWICIRIIVVFKEVLVSSYSVESYEHCSIIGAVIARTNFAAA